MFVGREDDLAQLSGLWGKRVASLVTCRGRRRVGKSTLIEEFAKRTAELGRGRGGNRRRFVLGCRGGRSRGRLILGGNGGFRRGLLILRRSGDFHRRLLLRCLCGSQGTSKQ